MSSETPKEARLRLGPIASKAVEGETENSRKVALIDTLISERDHLKAQLDNTRSHLNHMARFDSIFAQMNRLIGAMAESFDSQSELFKQRYIKHDRLHLRTRLLVASTITQGSERDQIFSQFDSIIESLQVHVDALELTDAQKAQARRTHAMRMQQLLTEAGAYENAMDDQQMEMEGLEPGGHER